MTCLTTTRSSSTPANNMEIDNVYSESNILGYVAGIFNPSEVFDTSDLEAWAEDHGYVKE